MKQTAEVKKSVENVARTPEGIPTVINSSEKATDNAHHSIIGEVMHAAAKGLGAAEKGLHAVHHHVPGILKNITEAAEVAAEALHTEGENPVEQAVAGVAAGVAKVVIGSAVAGAALAGLAVAPEIEIPIITAVLGETATSAGVAAGIGSVVQEFVDHVTEPVGEAVKAGVQTAFSYLSGTTKNATTFSNQQSTPETHFMKQPSQPPHSSVHRTFVKIFSNPMKHSVDDVRQQFYHLLAENSRKVEEKYPDYFSVYQSIHHAALPENCDVLKMTAQFMTHQDNVIMNHQIAQLKKDIIQDIYTSLQAQTSMHSVDDIIQQYRSQDTLKQAIATDLKAKIIKTARSTQPAQENWLNGSVNLDHVLGVQAHIESELAQAKVDLGRLNIPETQVKTAQEHAQLKFETTLKNLEQHVLEEINGTRRDIRKLSEIQKQQFEQNAEISQHIHEVKSYLAEIRAQQRAEQERQRTEQDWNNINQGCKFVEALGAFSKNPNLVKVGQIGQASVSIAKSFQALKEASTATDVLGGLAGIGLGVLSIADILGGNDSEPDPFPQMVMEALAKLSQQIEQFRQEMHARFDRIEEMQRVMMKEMLLGFSAVLQKLEDSLWLQKSMMRELADVRQSIHLLHTDVRYCLEQLSQTPVHSAVRAIYHPGVRQFVETIAATDYVRFQSELYLWLTNGCTRMHNGVGKIVGDVGVIQDHHLFAQALAPVHAKNQYNFLGLFAGIANTWETLKKVGDETSLINPELWRFVFQAYEHLILHANPQLNRDKSAHLTEIGKIKDKATEVVDFMTALKSSSIFKEMVKSTAESYLKLRKIVQDELRAEMEIPDSSGEGVDFIRGRESFSQFKQRLQQDTRLQTTDTSLVDRIRDGGYEVSNYIGPSGCYTINEFIDIDKAIPIFDEYSSEGFVDDENARKSFYKSCGVHDFNYMDRLNEGKLSQLLQNPFLKLAVKAGFAKINRVYSGHSDYANSPFTSTTIACDINLEIGESKLNLLRTVTFRRHNGGCYFYGPMGHHCLFGTWQHPVIEIRENKLISENALDEFLWEKLREKLMGHAANVKREILANPQFEEELKKCEAIEAQLKAFFQLFGMNFEEEMKKVTMAHAIYALFPRLPQREDINWGKVSIRKALQRDLDLDLKEAVFNTHGELRFDHLLTFLNGDDQWITGVDKKINSKIQAVDLEKLPLIVTIRNSIYQLDALYAAVESMTFTPETPAHTKSETQTLLEQLRQENLELRQQVSSLLAGQEQQSRENAALRQQMSLFMQMMSRHPVFSHQENTTQSFEPTGAGLRR